MSSTFIMTVIAPFKLESEDDSLRAEQDGAAFMEWLRPQLYKQVFLKHSTMSPEGGRLTCHRSTQVLEALFELSSCFVQVFKYRHVC